MTDEPAGETPPREPPPDDNGGDALAFRTPDRILAGVLLVGVLALGYICLDVLTDGRLTALITRRAADG